MHGSTRWHVFTDADAIAAEAVRRFLAAAATAITARGVFRIVLTGGHTPIRTYQLLSRAAVDWAGWQIYFSDERCSPPTHAARNSRAAALAWLDQVLIPKANIHPIPAELGPAAATIAYSQVVSTALPFDLVTLGMGENGHTASLFPDQVHPITESAPSVRGTPKPPPDRVSLSAHTLSNAHEILILVTGTGKRQAVAAWRAASPCQQPISAVKQAWTPYSTKPPPRSDFVGQGCPTSFQAPTCLKTRRKTKCFRFAA